jgi:hypothetical protein
VSLDVAQVELQCYNSETIIYADFINYLI